LSTCIDNVEHNVKLLFNIDGLPLFKSSNTQLWPILGIAEVSRNRSSPFVVGVLCGSSKPSLCSEFLSDFVAELTEVCSSGIAINELVFQVKKVLFICNAPARSWLKRIKPHNSYHACERCEVKGTYVSRRVVYTDLDQEARTDEKFAEKAYVRTGHQEVSILETTGTVVPLGMVTGFVLDYMHLVLLGVTRRLLYY
jgi:hypothetical protein